MNSLTPPKIAAVEIIAAQPTEPDRSTIAHLSAQTGKGLDDVAYLIKVQFVQMPPVTSQGWALYVGDFRVPKYWAYKEGIYFKVFDPHFFTEHDGDALRFSVDGTSFVETGKKLVPPKAKLQKATRDATKLPSQEEVLK